ncbi:MAG: hypothetical protein ACRDI2_11860, partial [Chloroflexota bacterium]
DLATRCAPAITRAGGEAPLETVREAIRASALPNAARAAEHLEALLPPAGYEIVWRSLFDASVRKT